MKFKYFILILFLFFLFQPVNALTNYDTKFEFNYSYLPNFNNIEVDTNGTKLIDFLNNIKNDSNIVYTNDYLFLIEYTSGNVSKIYFYIYNSLDGVSLNIYGNTTNVVNSYLPIGGHKNKILDFSNLPSDIYSSTFYSGIISCLNHQSCSSDNNYYTAKKLIFASSTTIDNTSNNSLTFSPNGFFFYYSSFPLVLTDSQYSSNTSAFYKTLYFNNISYSIGDSFPTYYEYSQSLNPEPEPEPDSDKTLVDYVFWFSDNSTELDILKNIYTLLFLYCIGNMFIKFITIIYHTKNLNNRR